MKKRSIACWLLLLGACGPSSTAKDPVDDDSDPDAGPIEEVAGFDADERPSTGAAAWLEAAVDGADVGVTVRTRDLGALFGLSVHLAWDADALELTTPVERTAAEAVLDPESSGDAVAIALARPGDVALGGTRASPEAGEVTNEGEATLATVRLRATSAGRSRLELTRALLAHADGTFTALPAFGGALVTLEVAP